MKLFNINIWNKVDLFLFLGVRLYILDFLFLELFVLLGPLKLGAIQAPERFSFKTHSPHFDVIKPPRRSNFWTLCFATMARNHSRNGFSVCSAARFPGAAFFLGSGRSLLLGGVLIIDEKMQMPIILCHILCITL